MDNYVSYVKGTDGYWYCFSDSTRTGVQVEDVLKQEAYLLFYEKKTEKDAHVRSRFEDSDED